MRHILLADVTFAKPVIISLCIGVFSLCIGVTALFIGIKNYLRKKGVHVRGIFTMRSSIECDDKYVSEVILENLKDRAITIFAIYLRVGHHCYIELENREDEPLVLKAFETYHKQFGASEFYSCNLHRIDLTDLFADDRAKKRLVLSTSDGKHIVPSIMRRWNPNYEYFRNYMTVIVHPVRSTVKGKDIGGNVKYVVELIPEKGEEEIVLLYSRDYETKRFREFDLTFESLSSKEALEQFFHKMQEEGKLQSTKIVVHDLEGWRKRKNHLYEKEPAKIEYASALEYRVKGRVYSKYENWKTDRNNARRLRTQKTK
jgi:hypothetical protein